MSFRLTHTVVYVRLSFLAEAEYKPILCIDHVPSIHSSSSGRLGCFHLLATVNNSAVILGVRLPVEPLLFQFF